MKIPCTMPRIVVQTWDLELLTPNDALCESNIQLGAFFKAAEKKKARNSAELDLGMKHPNFRGEQAQISLSMEVMPRKDAEDDPVDDGRTPELMTRENPMYTYYRPPGAFPAFGLWAIIKAKLAPLKKYCYACCCIIICLCFGGIGLSVMMM